MPNLVTTHTPPQAIKKPHKINQLGRSRTDNYAWIKDENWQAVMQDPMQLDPEIRHHLEAENTYAKAVLADLGELKDDIFEEMKSRQEPIDSSVPSPDGPWAYYHRYREGDQHGVYCRVGYDGAARKPADNAVDILDAEILASEQTGFFDLGTVTHSPDHAYLAYAVDRKGSEVYEVFLKPMDGPAQTTGIDKSAGGLQWAADSRTLFWVERDENQRPHAVYAKDVLAPSSEAQLIYKETDPGFFVSISESDGGKFIEISAHNHTTSEIWLIPMEAPWAKPQCLSPRQHGLEYSLHEQGDYLYLLTNANGATDFQVMRLPLSAVGTSSSTSQAWEPYIPHTPGTLIIGLESYKHFLVRLVRENALPRIIIRDMRDESEHEIVFDEAAYSLGLMGGYDYDTPWLRFAYSSPTTPQQVFDYNMENRDRILQKTQSIPRGHEPSDYTTERLHITVRDGETVPVTLLSHKDTPRDGTAPLLLYGYGSYGITIPAGFRTTPLSLVDRGFIYAIAHIRGGMSKGYQWYLDGKLEKKTNTFNDFVDVGHGLVDAGYTQNGRIVAHGGSAGGLLVGAAVNQAPELFGGILAAVPFVDVLNTMSDESLPLTPPEWPEWGNPLEDSAAYDRIESYSPYDTVHDTVYPPIFITAGLTDPRVTYWEPAKWAAKLRDHQKGTAPILMKTNMDAGHQGESGRYDSLRDLALEYAFAVTVCQTPT